jgi:hypothetical protein
LKSTIIIINPDEEVAQDAVPAVYLNLTIHYITSKSIEICLYAIKN